MDKVLRERWHDLPSERVAELLTTDERMGLDTHEVERRRMQFGANRLPDRGGKGLVSLFVSQFRQPLVYLLLVAAAITAALHEWTAASVIFGVVLLNAVIGVLQEARAARALGALARSVTTVATAVRGGRPSSPTSSWDASSWSACCYWPELSVSSSGCWPPAAPKPWHGP